MFKNVQMTLGKKLFLFSFVCILAVVAACSVYVWYDARQTLLEREAHNAKMLVRLLTVKMDKLSQDIYLRISQPYTGSNEWEAVTLFNLLSDWSSGKDVDPDAAQFAQMNLNNAAGNGVKRVYAIPVAYAGQLILRNADSKDGYPDPLPTGGVSFRPQQDLLIQKALKAKGKTVYGISEPGGFFHYIKELRDPKAGERTVIGGLALRHPQDSSLDWVIIMEFDWAVFSNVTADLEPEDQQRVILLDQDDRFLTGAEGAGTTGKLFELGGSVVKGAANADKGSTSEFVETADGSEYLVASQMSAKNGWKVMMFHDLNDLVATGMTTYLIIAAVALALIAFVATEIAFFTRSNISRPIRMLSGAMNALDSEQQQLERVEVTSNDEIGELAKAMNFTITLIERVNADSIAISNQKRSIQNLLDLSGEGFVSFGDDFKVHAEYSAECKRIFGKEIAGESWLELIFGEEAMMYSSIFGEIFQQPDAIQAELFLSLLPTEWKKGRNVYELEYKMITRDRKKAVMVIIADVTAQRKLEEKLQSESKVLKMIVKVLPNKDDFMQSLRDFERFYSEELQDMYDSGDPAESIKEIAYRRVHTFKGTFAQFGLIYTVEQLHQLESALNEVEVEGLDEEAATAGTADGDGAGIGKGLSPGVAMLKEYLDSIEWETMLDQDKFLLTDILGKDFFSGGRRLVIDEEQYRDMQERILEYLPENEAEVVKKELKSLQWKPFKELMQSYPSYVLELSERFEKSIEPFEIQGGEVPVDADAYRPFAKSLIHVFRNIVDHGIEMPDDRLELGKEERGQIRFEIELDEEAQLLSILIADDGGGIDPERIREKAIDKEIASEEELMTWPDQQLIELIFHDGFSTKDTVSTMSGRGVGMSAVKMEAEALGGSLEVNSEVGAGTTFKFRLPVLK